MRMGLTRRKLPYAPIPNHGVGKAGGKEGKLEAIARANSLLEQRIDVRERLRLLVRDEEDDEEKRRKRDFDFHFFTFSP